MQLYIPESVYALDRGAIEKDHLSGTELMARAGECVWRELSRRWPGVTRVSIFAGAGNNGGDAFVVAECARRAGVDVQLVTLGDLSHQSDSARHFRECWQTGGGSCEDWAGQAIDGDVIVDGLLGIGLQRELDPDWQNLIEKINRPAVPRVAIDIPSGLNGLTGAVRPIAVRADLTVTFIARKTGQFLADGPDYCGELVFTDLGASSLSRVGIDAALEVLERCPLPPPRRVNSHKNHYGHVLVVGGAPGMSGAVALAARAALRSGAGLVTALVHSECRGSLDPFAEIMALDWRSLDDKLAQASVVLVGPGLGDSAAADDCLERLQQCSKPMVIDASALRAPFLRALNAEHRVITPHPGEAAVLLETSAAAIQANRMAAATSLVENFGGVAVLKGSGTLVAGEGRSTAINTAGHAGMASAGMGDVLGGVIVALLAQGMEPADAARTGVFLHAACADDFARDTAPEGMIASDIIDRLPSVMLRMRDGV